MQRILIVGCGFVGLELAKQLREAGNARVFALTRSGERAQSLQKVGIEPVVGHWLDAAKLASLPAFDSSFDAVLVSVPHREDGGLGVETHVNGLKNLLSALPDGWRKLVYLSTTGVYGEAHDEVDEATPTQPTRIGPQIAVAAEYWLREQFASPQLTIVRLAGIYGPGRIPLAEKLKSGEVLQVPQTGWLNLIHVSDIAAMLRRAFEEPLTESLYVFSDGNPVARMEFYHHLAALCGVENPKFAEPDPGTSRSQRAGTKRVNPQRLITELKLELQFPSYREGLIDCLGDKPLNS